MYKCKDCKMLVPEILLEDCGIDTDEEIECPFCGGVAIPIEE